jgi:hypothetical protein
MYSSLPEGPTQEVNHSYKRGIEDKTDGYLTFVLLNIKNSGIKSLFSNVNTAPPVSYMTLC